MFDYNCTNGVECLFSNWSVLEDVDNVGELLGKGRKDTHDKVSLCNFVWNPLQLLAGVRK